MRNILKEPLFHFLLIGAALFVVFGLVRGRSSGDGDNEVVVSAGRIDQLANIFAKTWQRPPTRQELEGLIADFILEEVYYRQAVAMGIDRDDTIIRRRLRQKFEFLTDDALSVEPTEEELAAYLSDHEDDFRRDSTYTFRQVYINPEKPGDQLEKYVTEQLAELRAGRVPAGGLGLLPSSFDRAPGRTVDGAFGTGFSTKIDALSVDEWRGPIESGLGLHLVRLESRVVGTVPELAEIRAVVEREWANEMRIENRRQINQALLENYEVVIEWPDGETEEEKADPGAAP